VLARALAGDAIGRTAADLDTFRFESVKAGDDLMMLPGVLKYGGLGAFAALCAPGELLLHNHRNTGTGALPPAAYRAAAASVRPAAARGGGAAGGECRGMAAGGGVNSSDPFRRAAKRAGRDIMPSTVDSPRAARYSRRHAETIRSQPAPGARGPP